MELWELFCCLLCKMVRDTKYYIILFILLKKNYPKTPKWYNLFVNILNAHILDFIYFYLYFSFSNSVYIIQFCFINVYLFDERFISVPIKGLNCISFVSWWRKANTKDEIVVKNKLTKLLWLFVQLNEWIKMKIYLKKKTLLHISFEICLWRRHLFLLAKHTLREYINVDHS